MGPLAIAGIGAGVSALGSLFGSSKAKRAARKQRKILNQLNEDNENMFLKDYYTDFMDDPSSRSYLKKIEKNLYDKNRATENGAIATGATHENVLAQKQANNEVMSDAINNVVINHEQKKDAAKDRYLNRKTAITSGRMDLAQQEAQNWSNLGGNIADSVTGLASTYLMSGGKLFGNKAAPAVTSPALPQEEVSKNLNFMKNNGIQYKSPYTQY